MQYIDEPGVWAYYKRSERECTNAFSRLAVKFDATLFTCLSMLWGGDDVERVSYFTMGHSEKEMNYRYVLVGYRGDLSGFYGRKYLENFSHVSVYIQKESLAKTASAQEFLDGACDGHNPSVVVLAKQHCDVADDTLDVFAKKCAKACDLLQNVIVSDEFLDTSKWLCTIDYSPLLVESALKGLPFDKVVCMPITRGGVTKPACYAHLNNGESVCNTIAL